MSKLYELLRKGQPLVGDFGIEIEAEGENMKAVNNKWWGTHDDGSLRGEFPHSRAEYVLNAPVLKKDVRAVLKQLAKSLEGAKFDFSFRTSVHVHMNAQDLEYVQVLNVIYTYLLLEEPLLNFCGRGRKGNRFCLRLQDAEGILDTLNALFSREGKYGLAAIQEDNVRYSSINIGALVKYGSIEFRAMRGTMEIDVLTTWVDALHNIKEFAKGQKDPYAIYELFSSIGVEAFMKKVLGKTYEAFAYARAERDIARSYSLSMDLPYAYKSFVEAPKQPEKKLIKVDADTLDRVRKDAEERLKRFGKLNMDYVAWFLDRAPHVLEELGVDLNGRKVARAVPQPAPIDFRFNPVPGMIAAMYDVQQQPEEDEEE